MTLDNWVNAADKPTANSQACKCYYCPEVFQTPWEHLKHSVNKHPGKPAQPNLEMIQKIQDEWVYDDPNVDPKDYYVEPLGNPWEKSLQQTNNIDDEETVTDEEIEQEGKRVIEDMFGSDDDLEVEAGPEPEEEDAI